MTIRLIDLNPRWIQGGQWTDSSGTMHFPNYDLSNPRHGMGVTFECPLHRDHRLGVWFANPVDGKPPIDGKETLWQRTGATFEEISLSPSIDASEHGCWHGHIANGEVR